MALKAKLEKLDGLPADVSKEYKKVEEEGKVVYVLDVEGGEDVGALKRAKDHEKEQRREAEKRFKEASDRLAALEEEREQILKGAIPKGDVDKLEKSYQEKLNKREKELTTELEVARSSLNGLLVDNVAQKLATEISTAPAVMLPHIRSRLTTDKVEGKVITRVLDKEGKPSALSVDDLQKELCNDPQFKAIILGSKATGGGASGNPGGGATGNPKFNFAKASPKEIAEHLKATGKVKET